MPTIDKLSSVSALSDRDKIPLFSATQDDTRAVSLTQLARFVQTEIEGEPDETLYGLNMVDGAFTVAALPIIAGAGVWVQLRLTGPATTGIVILPGIDDRVPDQEVLVTCTEAVAALTVSGNGAAVLGAPAALAANGFFRLRFDNISLAWYRVG